MTHHILVLHGGQTAADYEDYLKKLKNKTINSLDDFKRENWRKNLQQDLGDAFEVVAPTMPNKDNAKYVEWKIWFEKIIPLLNQEVTLVGHSLGGMFFAKYLSENDFPKTIQGTLLVGSPYDDSETGWSLADFVLPQRLDKFAKQSPNIFLYYSEDDPIVPFSALKKYQKALLSATAVTFKDRHHFIQSEFPEVVKDIKTLHKNSL